jgi:cyanophycin synthetase
VDRTEATLKVGIIAVPGDRRDEDIRAMGMHAASMFDEIIIRHDKDLRGRTGENINELLLEGIGGTGKSVPVKVIPDETDALRFAIAASRPGSFIVLLSDEVKKTLDYLKQLEADEKYFNEEITVSE